MLFVAGLRIIKTYGLFILGKLFRREIFLFPLSYFRKPPKLIKVKAAYRMVLHHLAEFDPRIEPVFLHFHQKIPIRQYAGFEILNDNSFKPGSLRQLGM